MSRIAVCALLFAASCLFVVQRTAPVAAQEKKDKKDKDTTAMLEKQVAALKQDLAQAERQINVLKADIVQGANALAAAKTANAKLEAALKKEKGGDAKDDKTTKDLQTTIDGYRAAGLV